jgi:hypothetical protein
VETDFCNLPEVGIFFLPLDLAGEPAIEAPLIPPSARTIDAFQPHFCAGLYLGIE